MQTISKPRSGFARSWLHCVSAPAVVTAVGAFSWSLAMTARGWIKLHRKVLDSDVAGDFTAFGVWCWCLLRTNHKRAKWRGKTILPGQFVTGSTRGSEELGISRSAFYRALKRLEKYGYIETKVKRHATLVTICNWTTYQAKTSEGETEAKRKRNASETQVNTNKNKELRTQEPLDAPASSDASASSDACASVISGEMTAAEFFEKWNNFAERHNLRTCLKLTKLRRDKIATRLREREWLATFREAVKLLPLGGDGWQPTLDWLIQSEHNVYRIIEGEFEWRTADDPALARLQYQKRRKAAAAREDRIEREKREQQCLAHQTSKAIRNTLNPESGDGESPNGNDWLFGHPASE